MPVAGATSPITTWSPEFAGFGLPSNQPRLKQNVRKLRAFCHRCFFVLLAHFQLCRHFRRIDPSSCASRVIFSLSLTPAL
jgi:hypothetical protein